MIKRLFQLLCLASSMYALSHKQLAADEYCDGYKAGCTAGLDAAGCNDIYINYCDPTNHNNAGCRCGS